MSLYHEAAAILQDSERQGGSIKSRIYTNKKLRSSPKQLFALVSEALKWSAVLKDIIEKSQLLEAERKLSPALALLLVHDLLISKGGISLAASHPLKSATQKHKARLQAELTRLRVKRGFATLDLLRTDINRQTNNAAEAPTVSEAPATYGRDTFASSRPRWVRINTLRTTLKEQLSSTFVRYDQLDLLGSLMEPNNIGRKVLHIDEHVPDLLAFPAGTDLTTSQAYLKGEIILQDKASCFPALLLEPASVSGDLLDACAAPGNKTTHLAALLAPSSGQRPKDTSTTVWAIERDKTRASTLSKMIEQAGAQSLVSIRAPQDFLRLKPSEKICKNVRALLLDPSCSGSGIVGRDDTMPELHLPERSASLGSRGANNKRKRPKEQSIISPSTADEETDTESVPGVNGPVDKDLPIRLAALSSFQHKLLLHALSFPAASRVTYSTCSIYAEENEGVVISALRSGVAQQGGWRILRRDEQVAGLRRWDIRGDEKACRSLFESEAEANEVSGSCIRCNKDDFQGTMGFFVAGFIRDEAPSAETLVSRARVESPYQGANQAGELAGEGEPEWQGFSDTETA